jgi:hypothetical protein
MTQSTSARMTGNSPSPSEALCETRARGHGVYGPTARACSTCTAAPFRHERRLLDWWPMRRFEYPPSGVRDRDAADVDDLLARLNGLTLDCCEPAAEQAA